MAELGKSIGLRRNNGSAISCRRSRSAAMACYPSLLACLLVCLDLVFESAFKAVSFYIELVVHL